MLFNSIDFVIFLPIVLLLYWYVTNSSLKLQNLFVTASSYLFYGWWDYRFLSLIFFSSVVDFLIGRKLSNEANTNKRKLLLWLSLIINLGLLGYFKYSNFFIDSFVDAFLFFGKRIDVQSLNIILPVGISFYTFQTLSYTIDVYKKELKPTKDFISFTAFVSFFPQLVAGPIERASNLLPQFYKKRTFDYNKAVDGLRQILWGLFKKMVVADLCAEYVNKAFEDPSQEKGSTLLLGAIFFAFQIYGDFSGYSDIAIGTSRLFGFNLNRNFAFPYFSRDIAEFWRRWHISLSTWFRDYLYIPLGGSKGNLWLKIRNTFIIFIVSGFWHGANWTFIIWGALNALFFLPLLLRKKNRRNLDNPSQGKILPSFADFLKIASTFALTVFAWIFFRAENLTHAWKIIIGIFNSSLLGRPKYHPTLILLIIFIFVLIEWLGRENEYAIEKTGHSWPRPIRWAFYSFICCSIGLFMQTNETPFVYFQF